MDKSEEKFQQFTLIDIPEYPKKQVDFSVVKDATDKAKQSKSNIEQNLGVQVAELSKEVQSLRLYISSLHLNMQSLREYKSSQDKAIQELWTEIGRLLDDKNV